LFVNGPDIFNNSITQAIDQNLAPIVTTSYGECEAGWGSSELNILNALFKQGNAQGQTIVAASADQGATDCDAGPSAIEGLTVDFPGSSPYVTGMGGTAFNEGGASGTTQYWNGNSSSSTNNAGSANSYLPEITWDIPAYFSGSGGGPSSFFTKPAWQVGTGVPADDSRDEPDLALNASNTHDTFLLCMNVSSGESCTSGFNLTNSTPLSAGGTSFDSQIFGGMLALIEQKIGSRIGNANPTIYALANSSAYYTPGVTISTLGTVVFNDVTAGSNDEFCVGGTPSCPDGGSIGFNAGAGYDPVTGWGSINVYNLANAWKSVTPLGPGSLGPSLSATALTASTSSVPAGTSVTFTATVSGSAGTPTGSVQFFVNGIAAGSPVALSSGVAMYTLSTSCASIGQQLVTAAYLGSSTYQGSKGPLLNSGEAGIFGEGISSNGSFETSPLIVTVTSGACVTFTLSASQTINVASGGTVPSVTITATAQNGFTGTVFFQVTTLTTTSDYTPGYSLSLLSGTLTSTSTTASTVLTLSGIVADLRKQGFPGKTDPGTMLARQTSGPKPAPGGMWYAAGSGVTIASLLFLTLPRRRRLGGLLLVGLAVALAGGASGCGGSSLPGPPSGGNNEYAGQYVVTVEAASGSVVTSTTVTYNVN
jgi:hypothetical protein